MCGGQCEGLQAEHDMVTHLGLDTTALPSPTGGPGSHLGIPPSKDAPILGTSVRLFSVQAGSTFTSPKAHLPCLQGCAAAL